MSSELVTLNIYKQNGFGVIGSQLDDENSIANIVSRTIAENKRKEEEQLKEKQREAMAKMAFKSFPTSSMTNLLPISGFYATGENVKIAPHKAGITPSATLNGFDYTSISDSDYAAAGTTLSNMITTNLFNPINITIGANRYTTLADLAVEGTTYKDTTKYNRGSASSSGAILLPMDLITLSNTTVDIGLLVVEVYDTTFKLNDRCEVTFTGTVDTTVDTLGGNDYSDAPLNFNFDSGEVVATAKDTNGNVYSVKSGYKIGQFVDYLEDDVLPPINMSEYTTSSANPNYECGKKEIVLEKPVESSVYRPVKHTSNIPDKGTALCAFSCYVKGFLIFNTNTKDNNDQYHTNMIWLEVPILVNVTKEDSKYKVTIGELITTSESADNGSIKINVNAFGENSIAYLPTESNFYKNNFSNVVHNNMTFAIQSLCKYYSQ